MLACAPLVLSVHRPLRWRLTPRNHDGLMTLPARGARMPLPPQRCASTAQAA
jgi:hypothetical protein